MNMRLLGARTIDELVPEMVDASALNQHIVSVPTDHLFEQTCTSIALAGVRDCTDAIYRPAIADHQAQAVSLDLGEERRTIIDSSSRFTYRIFSLHHLPCIRTLLHNYNETFTLRVLDFLSSGGMWYPRNVRMRRGSLSWPGTHKPKGALIVDVNYHNPKIRSISKEG